MSSIFGYTGKTGDINTMANALKHWQPDRENTNSNEFCAFGILELFKTPECPINPQPYELDNITVLLDGRIDNRADLAKQLAIPNPEKQSDVAFVAAAFKKWNTECFKHLEGDFGICIWDQKSNQIILGRDPMGVKTLFYTIIDNQLFFASEIKGILSQLKSEVELNERQIVASFSAMEINKEDTIYQNIQTLLGGNFLVFTEGEIQTNAYWFLGKNAPAIPATRAEQEKIYNKLFYQSVIKRLRTYRKLGAEVSGGLDSTGIAAVAMETLGKGKEFYSYTYGKSKLVLDKKGEKDDVGLVREFCEEYKISDYLTVTDEEDMDAAKLIAFSGDFIDELDGNGVPTFTNSFLPQAQKSDVGVMFSGWAGDQMVTNTCGGFSEALAIKGKYKELMQDIKARQKGIKAYLNFCRFVWRSIYKPFYKLNLKKAQAALKVSPLNDSLKKKYKLNDIVGFRYFLKSQIDLKEYQIQNIFQPGINDRVVHHGLVGKHYRVDYRFPMIDVPLLEFIHQLPLSTVAPKGKTRFLFKKLIKGKVPDGVVNMHKSYVSTTPFSHAFLHLNWEFFKKEILILANKEKSKKYFNFDNFDFELQKNKLLELTQILKKINR